MPNGEVKKMLGRLGMLPTPFPTYGTAFLADAMQKLRIENCVTDPGIRPLIPFTRLVGTAVTLKLDVAGKGGTEKTVESYARAFDAGRRVSSPVLVIEMPFAKFGSIGSGAAHVMRNHYGFVGAVVDGVVRDTDELARMNFSVYYRYIHPEHVDGSLHGVSVNEPVRAGGVTINPGDIVVGDNDGVAVVPHDRLSEVLEVATEIMRIEEQIIREIDSGGRYEEVGKRHFRELLGKIER
jgi:4-hydroxy-4-methyl-2-oxoglutarate aldolase